MNARTLASPLVLALVGSIACRPAETSEVPPSETPPVVIETDDDSQSVDAERAPAQPITSIDDLRSAAQAGFAGRIGDDGVVFLDIYDDDSEETKTREAVRLCGDALEAKRIQWAENALARSTPERMRDAPFTCGAETCMHEAFEAGDHRGLYRFEQGYLAGVAWTSGPPGHIMQAALDAELEFVEEAFAALRDQPCGAVYPTRG